MTTTVMAATSLYGFTDDPGAASTDPVARPTADGHPLLWYRDTKPRFYRPYLIRVLKKEDTTMEFVFLHSRTGADLALSSPSYRIAYHDGRHAYSALPSTAPEVEPGSEKSSGLLFMSDLYIQSLPQEDQTALIDSGGGDGKWPNSLGGAAELVTRLHKQLGGHLSARDHADIASVLELLQKVA
jgi:hypothetical protein